MFKKYMYRYLGVNQENQQKLFKIPHAPNILIRNLTHVLFIPLIVGASGGVVNSIYQFVGSQTSNNEYLIVVKLLTLIVICLIYGFIGARNKYLLQMERILLQFGIHEDMTERPVFDETGLRELQELKKDMEKLKEGQN